MKVEALELTPAEIRQRAEAWFARQSETLELSHGREWPKHKHWIESFLKEEIRQRLLELGWRPKA